VCVHSTGWVPKTPEQRAEIAAAHQRADDRTEAFNALSPTDKTISMLQSNEENMRRGAPDMRPLFLAAGVIDIDGRPTGRRPIPGIGTFHQTAQANAPAGSIINSPGRRTPDYQLGTWEDREEWYNKPAPGANSNSEVA